MARNKSQLGDLAEDIANLGDLGAASFLCKRSKQGEPYSCAKARGGTKKVGRNALLVSVKTKGSFGVKGVVGTPAQEAARNNFKRAAMACKISVKPNRATGKMDGAEWRSCMSSKLNQSKGSTAARRAKTSTSAGRATTKANVKRDASRMHTPAAKAKAKATRARNAAAKKR